MDELMLKIDNVKKKYKLGEIGGTTLRDEFQRLHAKIHKKEDPTKKIGAKDYNKGETFMALNGVSFEVKKGERVGIIGHNGAGKSTLLKLISRVTAPTTGTISLNGRIASMLEVGTGFHPELTGRENVYMNGAILGMTKKEIDQKMQDIIEFSEVAQFIDTPVKRYSSGMYVKLAFSVAAHLSSEIMIMDEVLAVGDMTFQRKCIDKMNQVSKDEGRTILYVSHNMETIRQLCTRCVVLNHGQVIFNGDVEEAINIYLNVARTEAKPFVDCTKIERTEYSTGRAFINSIEFANKKECLFERGEKININVNWSSMEDLKDVRMRVIVYQADGNVVGTAMSAKVTDGEKNGTYISSFLLDTFPFINGLYYISLSLLQIDKLSNISLLDDLCRVITFDINESKVLEDSVSCWTRRGNGIHLPYINEINTVVIKNENN